MDARDLVVGEADLDDEEGDESFDEETGEVKPRGNGTNGHVDDSSDEEEDDDDEEAARQVPSAPSKLECVIHYGTDLASTVDSRRLHRRRGGGRACRAGAASEAGEEAPT